ncbi:MAG TPA: helix-turn-helix transcriptional regulator [Pyrinomonadaceae bacterium]|nr:helix-turn-helix transcriptional regulator [Pyrinomonadaceae bacterium]
MLVFNLTRILALRGIDTPYAFLVKRGFHRTIAANLSNNRTINIKIAHLEKICRALNCTPNDLFEWRNDEQNALGENHALNALKRNKTAQQVSRILKDIPVDKLERAEELLNQLKDE